MIRVLLALVLSGTFLPAKKKPNILFLFADDQRADTIAAHGNPHIQWGGLCGQSGHADDRSALDDTPP
jgi:arylsulfatase A-like enzyme